MNYLDNIFLKRESKHRRNYEIEDLLYTKLEELTNVYDASIADLVNASIQYLIETENIENYVKDPNEIVVTHTLLIRQSNLNGLDTLKDKYSISIYKLVNIAIRNLLKACDRLP